jgi:mRNA interferase MazF
VRRGEIWWVDDPLSGRRPFLVLTRDVAIDVLNAVIAVPATRTIRDIGTEVLLDRVDGMAEECVLATDNVTVMPKAHFTERITRLGPERMDQVCAALGVATGCA